MIISFWVSENFHPQKPLLETVFAESQDTSLQVFWNFSQIAFISIRR